MVTVAFVSISGPEIIPAIAITHSAAETTFKISIANLYAPFIFLSFMPAKIKTNRVGQILRM